MYIPHLHNRHFSKEQIEELKTEIRKTEYEKAREPLQKEIKELDSEIFDLKTKIEAYNILIRELYTSIEQDNIKLFIKTNPIEIQFGTIDEIKVQKSPYEPIDIPIKEEFRKSIHKRFYEILKGE